MNRPASFRVAPAYWLSIIACILCMHPSARADETATLDAQAEVPAGSQVRVTFAGPNNDYDAVIVVPPGTPDSEGGGGFSSYTVHPTGTVDVLTPEQPGQYEIRYITRHGQIRSTLARRKLSVSPVTASLDTPPTAAAGATIPIKWTGPNNIYDSIAVVPVGAPEHERSTFYSYTNGGNPAKVRIPEQPGQYEVRYLTGQTHSTLAHVNLSIGSVGASLQSPPTAFAGSSVPVTWSGPNNEYDKITIALPTEKDASGPRPYSAYTSAGNPATVTGPEQPGEYEIRYQTGQSGTTLARAKLTITPISATLEAPASVPAGTTYSVNWTGPNNLYDAIATFSKNSAEDQWESSALVEHGSPLSVRAPLTPGVYELRYQTGRSRTVLARAPLQVTPATQEPGLLVVTAGAANFPAGGVVEVILDASGSMLQRIGSKRKIDMAKQTLTHLTSSTIPAGTPFALRVFGHRADSCQTDLDVPLSPLDPRRVSKTIAGLTAKNGAKTPIGASLDKVAADLGSVHSERIVILVTDGEETCGGNPEAAIERLRQSGIGVHVNIVGFAIDDKQLRATFRFWSEAGGGKYFDAKDASGLDKAFRAALASSFEVRDGEDHVVATGAVGGDAVPLMPGEYRVRSSAKSGPAQSVSVRPKETARVEL